MSAIWSMWRRAVAVAVLGGLLVGAGAAHAETRAWLDRDRIAFGETTTLNVEGDDTTASPDWSPLEREFELSGHTSRRQVEIRNGRQTTRILHGVALRPRRDGVLTVPALQVGADRTAPLQLSVGPAAVTAARDGAPAFIEAEVDAQSPFVQQAVAYTLRLHYAVPLVSGQLEQPAPEGASLQRIGSDTQYTRDLDGRRYTVVERRFLLVPERSGTLTIPGARFEGRGVSGGMFDGLFNRGPRELSANGPPSLLSVRPMPAGAGAGWLPVRGVEAGWLEAPTTAQAGASATFVLEVRFDGAVGTQLPDIVLPAVDGAQVFAEPPQYDETFEDGRPQVRLTRRYSVVPQAAGTLRIEPPRIGWWDTGAGIARSASPPPVTLRVEPGATSASGVSGPATPPADVPSRDPVNDRLLPEARGWALAAAVFALLWLATAGLAWALHRRRARSPSGRERTGLPVQDAAAPVAVSSRQLRERLQTGDAAEVEQALRGRVVPPAPDLDVLQQRLDDPQQRAAVAAWQRARWRDGDLADARRQLQAAFRSGVREGAGSATEIADTLPPLYPRR